MNVCCGLVKVRGDCMIRSRGGDCELEFFIVACVECTRGEAMVHVLWDECSKNPTKRMCSFTLKGDTSVTSREDTQMT